MRKRLYIFTSVNYTSYQLTPTIFNVSFSLMLHNYFMHKEHVFCKIDSNLESSLFLSEALPN